MRNYKKIMSAALALALVGLTACGDISESTGNGAATTTTKTAVQSKVFLVDETSSEVQSSQAIDFPSTDNSSIVQPREAGSLDDDFTLGTMDFSVNLFKSVVEQDLADGKNVLISPESVLMALGMTANGANGETLTQMQEMLCAGMELDRFNENMLELKERANSAEYITFNNANSIWLKEDDSINFKEGFMLTADEFYGAKAFKKPFNQSTVDEINAWVNENTNEMIPAIIDNIDNNAIMYLINAITFEGEWAEVYDNHQVYASDKFTTANGEEQTVTMLTSLESTCIRDENSIGFIKDYKGGEYAFMAILPKEGISLEDYVSQMTGEGISDMYQKRFEAVVDAKIPEFTYDYDRPLSKPLSALGMTTAFDMNNADFTSMAETKDNNVYISEVFHKTFIQLDRYGTKAAAVTATMLGGGAAPTELESFEVHLDRPFVYAIIEKNSGVPMFIGAVNSIN